MTQLERYEWCDFWWSDTGEREKARVLLIGDSITRAYRPHVQALLKESVCVDMLATSKAVDNPSFLRELDYIVNHEKFTYGAVHFNNGLHGFHLSAEQYEEHYDIVIRFLLERIGDARLILALSTPVTEKGGLDKLDEEKNGQVLARNEAVRRIAQKHGLPVHDLYAAMEGRSEYRVPDGYHYNAEGSQAQAASVAAALEEQLRA